MSRPPLQIRTQFPRLSPVLSQVATSILIHICTLTIQFHVAAAVDQSSVLDASLFLPMGGSFAAFANPLFGADAQLQLKLQLKALTASYLAFLCCCCCCFCCCCWCFTAAAAAAASAAAAAASAAAAAKQKEAAADQAGAVPIILSSVIYYSSSFDKKMRGNNKGFQKARGNNKRWQLKLLLPLQIGSTLSDQLP